MDAKPEETIEIQMGDVEAKMLIIDDDLTVHIVDYKTGTLAKLPYGASAAIRKAIAIQLATWAKGAPS